MERGERDTEREREIEKERETERVIPCTNVSSLCMNPWDRTDGVRWSVSVYNYMDGVWNVVIR